MTRRDAVSVAFVLAGIYVWVRFGVYAVLYIPATLSIRQTSGVTHIPMSMLAICISCAVMFVIGYVFIFRASALAARIIPEETGNEPAFPCKAHDIQAVAISILGLMLAAKALPHLGSVGLEVVFLDHCIPGGARERLVDLRTRDAITQSFCLIVGLILFVKASALAALWRRWQQATPADSATTE